MTSVAIYSHEDRFGAHRNKVSVSADRDWARLGDGKLIFCVQADEAYLVGAGLTPVAAYLAQDDIIRVSSRARLSLAPLVPHINSPPPARSLSSMASA